MKTECSSNKFLFIHIPKCGGLSMSQTCRDNGILIDPRNADPKYLNEKFNENENIILNNIRRVNKGNPAASNWGRIAIMKKYFMEVRGYDETFQGWGWEERDFKQRIQLHLNLKDVKFEKHDSNFIEHESSFHRPKRSNLRNRELARQNRKEKRYIVNTGTDYGAISDLKIEGGRNW